MPDAVNPDRTGEPMLTVRELYAGYGEDEVLHGISLDVGAGEVVTLVGRNGAGKSTIMRSVMGILGKRRGSIAIKGRETIALAPERIARLGVGYVPEERGIFSRLSVEENLHLPRVVGPDPMPVGHIFELFPNLKERLGSPGTKLSGGEQQMLAIARVLRAGARFLLLDEPTEGLAPVIVQQIGRTIAALKTAGRSRSWSRTSGRLDRRDRISSSRRPRRRPAAPARDGGCRGAADPGLGI
jgi:branched-chain amino acid transport system ATP-binding protein